MPPEIEINVELPDILTGPVCSKLVSEFIKYMVYHRQQIPYNYQHLEAVLKSKSKKKLEDSLRISSLKAMKVEQEFLKVNEKYLTMQSTFKHLEEELSSDKGIIEEVVIVLGATPFSPKDVYRVQLPPIQSGHLAVNHSPQRSLLNLYQSLISSEELHLMMRQQLSPTNMYLFLKKQGDLVTDGFLFKDHFSLPANGQQVQISLIPKKSKVSMCEVCCTCLGISVFRDDKNVIEAGEEPIKLMGTSSWYQARAIMKGFKDMKIDGVSVTNLWQHI